MRINLASKSKMNGVRLGVECGRKRIIHLLIAKNFHIMTDKSKLKSLQIAEIF